MAKTSTSFLLVYGLVALGLILYILFEAGTSVTVVCERETGRPRCTVDLDELLFHDTKVYDDVIGVRVTERTRKGSTSYGVAIKIASGRETEVITYLPQSEAKQAEDWFASSEPRVAIKRGHSYGGWLALVLAPLGLAVVGIAWVLVNRWRRERRRRAESDVPIL